MIPFHQMGPRRRRGPAPSNPTTEPTFTLVKAPERAPEVGSEPRERAIRIMGLDLGQAVDPAAMSILRIRECDAKYVGPRYPFIFVSAMRVWPLGYDYTDLVSDALYSNPDAIVVDYCGVGRPFVDILYKEAMAVGYQGKIVPVQSASSNASVRIHTDSRRKRQHVVVPKIEIVTALNIAQQQKLLKLPAIPETKRLLEELRDFQMLYSRANNIKFQHRGSASGLKHHGDLAISLGLALWYYQRGRRELVMQ